MLRFLVDYEVTGRAAAPAPSIWRYPHANCIYPAQKPCLPALALINNCLKQSFHSFPSAFDFRAYHHPSFYTVRLSTITHSLCTAPATSDADTLFDDLKSIPKAELAQASPVMPTTAKQHKSLSVTLYAVSDAYNFFSLL